MGPTPSDVHVPRPLGSDAEEKKRKTDLVVYAKLAPSPLYVYRSVLNADEIIRWAKGQGFKTTMPPEQLHVTVCYSKQPVDWMAAGDAWTGEKNGDLKVNPGGPRAVEALGDGGAVCLLFGSTELTWQHMRFRDAGASWDYDEYQPHVTITWDAGDLDLSKVEPYRGAIEFGPEVFEPINTDWQSTLVEKSFSSFFKVSGVNEELGLVFGWGIICKDDNGADYYDVQKNHIPEDAMVAATTDFMKTAREAGDMHARMGAGTVVHSFPLTTDIAKAMGIETKKAGWMVAMAPDPAMLAKFKSGEYKGFSIGGEHLELDGKPVGTA